AKRLLVAAGYPNGFPGTMCFTDYGTPLLVDIMQLVQKDLKTVGIDVKIDQKEYGAYIATCFYGKFDSMTFGPQTGFLEPDNFLFGQYYPEELKNQSHINDPIVADMLKNQRRTLDLAKRREIIYDIQRHLAKQQYYVQMPSAIYIGVWEGALKNYGPNMGYDYGGRLMAAWLDREPRIRRARAQALSRQAPAGRDPVAADRVADRLHAAAADPWRRGDAHAGREGVRQGPGRAAGEARPGPAAAGAIRGMAGARGTQRPW